MNELANIINKNYQFTIIFKNITNDSYIFNRFFIAITSVII